MESRSQKYNSNMSRTKKNKDLYDDLYKDTNYSNMVVIDDSNEIDVDKIKQIIDREKRPTREVNNNYMYDSLKEYYNIDKKDDKKKTYDINEVLKNAKSKRDIIEEANEKRKIENYKFNNNYLHEELAKTRKVYNDLVKDETELLNIMNTLTSLDVDSNTENLSNTTQMANEMFNSLTENAIEKPKPIVKQVVEEDEEKDNSKEYSTNTFLFETKDFEGLKSVGESMKKSGLAVKIFIFIFTILVIVGCYFAITKYVLK